MSLPRDGRSEVSFQSRDSGRKAEVQLGFRLRGSRGHVSISIDSTNDLEICLMLDGTDVRRLPGPPG